MTGGRLAGVLGGCIIVLLAALIASRVGVQEEAVRLAALTEVTVPEDRDLQRSAVLDRLDLSLLRASGALSTDADVTVRSPTDRSFLSVRALADTVEEAEEAAIVVSNELVRLGAVVRTDREADRLTDATNRLLEVIDQLETAQVAVDAAIEAEADATRQVFQTAEEQRAAVDELIAARADEVVAARSTRNDLVEQRLMLETEVRSIRLLLDSTLPTFEIVDPLFEPASTNQRAVTFLLGGLALLGMIGLAISPQQPDLEPVPA